LKRATIRDTIGFVIVSFRHKGLAAFYRSGTTRGIQAAHAPKLARILASLNAAATPEELSHPGYRLHSLKGQRKGFLSIWVNANWRVTFRFTGNDIELVDYVDYH
jgi:proteic killer suppression protein